MIYSWDILDVRGRIEGGVSVEIQVDVSQMGQRGRLFWVPV